MAGAEAEAEDGLESEVEAEDGRESEAEGVPLTAPPTGLARRQWLGGCEPDSG